MMNPAILVLHHTLYFLGFCPHLQTNKRRSSDAEMEPFNTIIDFSAYVTLLSALGTSLLLLIRTAADNIKI